MVTGAGRGDRSADARRCCRGPIAGRLVASSAGARVPGGAAEAIAAATAARDRDVVPRGLALAEPMEAEASIAVPAGEVTEAARGRRVLGQPVALGEAPRERPARSGILAATSPLECAPPGGRSSVAQRPAADAVADLGPAPTGGPSGRAGLAARGVGEARIGARVDELGAGGRIGAAGDGERARFDDRVAGVPGDPGARDGRFEGARAVELATGRRSAEDRDPPIAAGGVLGVEAAPREIGGGREEEGEDEEHGLRTDSRRGCSARIGARGRPAEAGRRSGSTGRLIACAASRTLRHPSHNNDECRGQPRVAT